MLLLVLAAVASTGPPAKAAVQAVATIRIERPASASREAWERLPQSSRREIVIRDENGREILLRLVEQQ